MKYIMKHIVKHFEKLVVLLVVMLFCILLITQSLRGLAYAWPQIIVVLCVCWIEIRFTHREAQLYKELTEIHRKHIQLLTENTSIKSTIIARLINESRWIEQKTPPPVG